MVPLSSPRSEVSSSSSLESSGRSGRKMGIQALLHSEGLEASDEQGRDILSSQEDMFAADKSGTHQRRSLWQMGRNVEGKRGPGTRSLIRRQQHLGN